MSGRIDIWIAWGLQPIRCFLEEVPFHFEQRAAAVAKTEPDLLPDGQLGQREVYTAARNLSLAAVLERLNALVDEVLLMLAGRLLPPEWALTNHAMSRTLKQLLDAIARKYDVDVASLPGWSQVEAIREGANSLKHRGGILLPEPGALGLPVHRSVTLDVESLRQTIYDVSSWLSALWKATEGVNHHDAV
ncbi:MAG TPA: hypothetical protein DDX84_09150 [Nitrospiraceae bacterium]|nr:hypothetical protein [Nitrospiraceae bacterium]